ncbi:MAG: hypothetical protein PHY82_05585 [Lentisphaeria bacterium]|nr:hypothetical protein [Lentisphaeria bacterium]
MLFPGERLPTSGAIFAAFVSEVKREDHQHRGLECFLIDLADE